MVFDDSDDPDEQGPYVDSDFLVHYGHGHSDPYVRMSVADYTGILEIVPGKVAKKRKEINKALAISRMLSRLSLKIPYCSHLHGCRQRLRSHGGYRCVLVAFGYQFGGRPWLSINSIACGHRLAEMQLLLDFKIAQSWGGFLVDYHCCKLEFAQTLDLLKDTPQNSKLR